MVSPAWTSTSTSRCIPAPPVVELTTGGRTDPFSRPPADGKSGAASFGDFSRSADRDSSSELASSTFFYLQLPSTFFYLLLPSSTFVYLLLP